MGFGWFNNKYKVLVVCSANKGRSASFQAWMQHFITKKHIKNIEIESAGAKYLITHEIDHLLGTGAIEPVPTILNKYGIKEINNHKTKIVRLGLIKRADLILTFNTKIKKILIEHYSKYKNKITTVRGFVTGKEGNLPSEALDVDDAYRPNNKLYRNRMKPQTYKAFSKVCDESKRLVLRTLDKLKKQLK